MSNTISLAKLYSRVSCFVLFFVAASASFNGFYVDCHFHEVGVSGGWDVDSFERMVDGTANRPYIYRQLLPTAANWLDKVVPETIKTRLYDRQGSAPDAFINAMSYSPTARNKVYFFRYLVVYILTFLFAVLGVYAMYLVSKAMGVSQPAAVFGSVIVMLLLPYIMSKSGFNYDYPELAFMALAVWITLKFDWWWAIPIAALGTWNKESFLLFIPALYPFLRAHSSRTGALLRVGALCLVCAAVYLPVHFRFAHNPGSTVVLQWFDQLQSLGHPRDLLFSTQETYGVRVPRAFSVIPMVLIVWSVRQGWKKLPPAVKRHGQIAAAINIPLYLLFCTPGELRNLSMLYIFFLLTLSIGLSDWIRRITCDVATVDGTREVL